MWSMLRFFTLRNKNSAIESENNADNEKLLAIIEIVIIVFLTSFIPALIKLGRPPVSLDEVWVELLIALMASIYAYMRIRGIDLKKD